MTFVHWRRILAAGIVSGVALSSLSGCSNEQEAQSQKTSIVIPALWVGSKGDEVVAGVELAGITLDGNSSAAEAGFSIDLADIKAQGAGAQWTAATASATVTATILSATDPTTVHADFTVTGQIDGPSAGGILTVGLLSLLRGEPLRSEVTMTGTISPNGAIGAVGGVPEKIKAAIKAGYTTILIPRGSDVMVTGTDGTESTLAKSSSRGGVTVIPVSTVQEAYEHFTGSQLAPTAPLLPGFTPAVEQAMRATTESRLAETSRLLARSVGLRKDLRILAREQWEQADAALTAGNLAEAYAISTQITSMVSRTLAGRRARVEAKAQGLAVTSLAIERSASEVEASARALIASLSSRPGLSDGQRFDALSILARLEATEAAASTLANGDVAADLAEIERTARILQDQRTALDVYVPDALAILDAMPSLPPSSDTSVAEYLSGYTNFLVAAGQANQEYASDVMGIGNQQAPETSYLFFAVEALRASATAIPSNQQSLPEEVEQSASALAYYAWSARLVDTAQGFALVDADLGQKPALIADPRTLTESVLGVSQLLASFASEAAKSGDDSSLTVWSGMCADALYRHVMDTGFQGVGAIAALDDLTFALLPTAMLTSMNGVNP